MYFKTTLLKIQNTFKYNGTDTARTENFIIVPTYYFMNLMEVDDGGGRNIVVLQRE